MQPNHSQETISLDKPEEWETTLRPLKDYYDAFDDEANNNRGKEIGAFLEGAQNVQCEGLPRSFPITLDEAEFVVRLLHKGQAAAASQQAILTITKGLSMIYRRRAGLSEHPDPAESKLVED